MATAAFLLTSTCRSPQSAIPSSVQHLSQARVREHCTGGVHSRISNFKNMWLSDYLCLQYMYMLSNLTHTFFSQAILALTEALLRWWLKIGSQERIGFCVQYTLHCALPAEHAEPSRVMLFFLLGFQSEIQCRCWRMCPRPPRFTQPSLLTPILAQSSV